MNLNNTIKNIVIPYISEKLINEAAFRNISEVAEKLPEKLTTYFGFECPLGVEDPISDFLLRISAKPYGRDTLCGQLFRSSLPSNWHQHLAWKKLDRFAQVWNNPNSKLYHEADDLWLEFDIDSNTGTTVPVPSFFFGIPTPEENPEIQNQQTGIIQLGLETLHSKALEPSVLRILNSIDQCMPKGAYVFQVGTMISRPEHIYRLCIMMDEITQAVPFLKEIGWNGNLEALERSIQRIIPYVDYIALDIDVTDTIGPKIGLECYMEESEEALEKWQQFLGWLQSENLCTVEKADSLLSYPKLLAHGIVPKEKWAPHHLQMSKIIGRNYGSFYHHKINHIKIDFKDLDFFQAKAYLGIGQYWASINKVKAALAKHQLEKIG